MNEMKNSKVVKGEAVTKQHYLVVGELNIKRGRKGMKRSVPKIMW